MVASSSSAPPPANSLVARYAAWISRRSVAVLLVSLGFMVLSGYLAARLELRTAISELLPNKDPGVLAMMETQRRVGNLTLLLVGVHSPDRAANARLADVITQKLKSLPPEVCENAAYNVRDIRSFFTDNRWLYAQENDLEEIRDRLRREIGKRKNPLLVDLSDDDETPEQMRARLEKNNGDRLGGRFPDGLFSNTDGTYVWIAALPPGGLFVEHGGESLHDAARAIIASLDLPSFHPEMRVDISGPVASAIATRQAVERDIVSVTVTCLIIVALSIGLYFRKVRAVPLIGIPAVLGTLMAFGVAELAFGYLNSSTAFLGSIIVGNGINYGIVLMSRYEEQRARGDAPAVALPIALAGVLRGTAVAAVCAAAAYASLMLTSFRGFSQFGVMGAAGVVFCWLATFIVLPALLALLDRRQVQSAGRSAAPFSLAPLGRLLGRHPGALMLLSTVITAVCVFGLRHFLSNPFEYDFRKLNTRVTQTAEKKGFEQSLDRLFGRWPFPTIVLVDKLSDAKPLEAAIRKQDAATGGAPSVGQIVTVWDVLPGTPDAQQRKLALLADIRKLTHDPALKVLTDEERKTITALDPPEALRELRPQDLPPLARRPFTEVDGTVGRVVLVYPPEHDFSVWNGRDLLRMASAVQYIHMPDGRVIETSGNAVVFASMLRSILRDGPLATVVSLGAVIVLMMLIIRPAWAAAAALFSLILGVVWMMGAAGLAQVSITFLNFIALPITFGIGTEYASNVIARDRETGDMIKAVTSTGAAVALCSWTTIVGYGSLLAARNQALQGFGEMAILGEIACLSTAIIAMPAFFLWRERRRARATPAS